MANDLAVLEQHIDSIAATCERINAAERESELDALNQRVSRIAVSCHHLERLEQRRDLAERDPLDPRLKRRLPQVTKTMMGPAESANFLARATAAFRSGGSPALIVFAVGERRAGRLE